MKNLVKTLLSIVMVSLLTINASNAQSIKTSPCSSPIVDATCVGACGSVGIMTYSNLSAAFSLTAVDDFCVTTESSSLCPTHNSKTAIYVNRSLIATYNSTSAGTSYQFSALKGSTIVVKTGIFTTPSKEVCVWLGEVDLSLRKTP